MAAPSSPPWRVFDAPSPDPGSAPPPSRSGGGDSQSVARLGLLGAAAAIGVLALIVALTGSPGGSVEGPGTAAGGGASVPEVAGPLVVDVAGAVARPGVYRLPAGSRVGDAIAAAGGFAPGVEADVVAAALNLAAPLADGQQILVPGRAAASSAGPEGSSPAGGRVDLNRATAAELDALPGIGPATAAKIIASREQQRFSSVQDLRTRGLVGEAAFAKLRDLVTVG